MDLLYQWVSEALSVQMRYDLPENQAGANQIGPANRRADAPLQVGRVVSRRAVSSSLAHLWRIGVRAQVDLARSAPECFQSAWFLSD